MCNEIWQGVILIILFLDLSLTLGPTPYFNDEIITNTSADDQPSIAIPTQFPVEQYQSGND